MEYAFVNRFLMFIVKLFMMCIDERFCGKIPAGQEPAGARMRQRYKQHGRI